MNDSTTQLSDAQLSALENADCNSIVFMHHPIHFLSEPCREKMRFWRETHKDTFLFYGHLHETIIENNTISLQAIGECPCITYFDTDKKHLRKAYYFSPVPHDFYEFIGISCYDTINHIAYCTHNGLKNLELRPNCIHNYKEHEYVFNFMSDAAKMKIIKDAGVVISIGSDSHNCDEYNGYDLYRMYDYLKANGFKTF